MYIHSGNTGKGFILLAICPNNNYSNSDQKCAIYEACPIHNVLSILSRSQCWPISSRHFVYIVDLLSCLHRPHRNVHRHRVDIVFFFILFHRQHRRNSNIDRHRIDIVHLLSCLYRQHRNVVRHRVYIVPFLRYNQCKFNIGSTSYTLPCGRCKRQRNVSKVDGVNSISVKHRRCCEVDDVNVKEISTMSYDVMLILYQCCIHRHGDNIEKGICIGHVWRMSDCWYDTFHVVHRIRVRHRCHALI